MKVETKANFPVFHGVKLANNAFVENMRVESLDSDPVVSNPGHVWFNTTDKSWNASFLNAGGAVVVRKFGTKEDFDAFVADLLSTAAGKGTNLVGFQGHAGTNSQFSISTVSLKSALDSIIDKIDSNSQSIEDIGSGNLVNMQNELDATQAAAGLAADGTYVTPSSSSYIASTTTLAQATTVLASSLKTEETARIAADSTLTTNLATEVTNRTNADTAIQAELDATQAGAGLGTDGAYVVHSGSNFIAAATTLDSATTILDGSLKAEETARTNADSTLTTNLATEVTNRTNADTAIRTDFASTANAKGASLVGIEDASSLFTATTVEGALTELHNDLTTAATTLSMQDIYDNSVPVGGEVIVTLAADKQIKFKDNNDNTYFSLDPDGANPIKVSMSGSVAISGDMTISGNLAVTGNTTEITSQITDADHFALKPAGNPAALTVEPTTNFTGDTVVDIKSQNGGTSVLTITKTDATVAVTKLTASNSVVVNGSTTLNGTLAVNEDVTVASSTVLNFGANKLTNIADAVAVTDAVSLGQLNTAVSNSTSNVAAEEAARIAADAALQTELDTTQTGAGLNANGTYTATGAANYTSAATSLKDADVKLDAALKVEETARIAADSALQSELDATQAGAGLGTDGAYTANGSANYVSTATTLKSADNLLDAALKTEETARISAVNTLTTNLATEVTNRTNADSAIQSELDATQAGAGLGTDGAYTANGSANYISAATTLKSADNALDTALKAVSDELNTSQTGAGLGADGTYTANGSANYVSSAVSLKDADNKLDAALKTANDTIIANLATVNSAISAEASARTAADTQIRTDVNAQIFTFESGAAALTHTVTHNLNATFVNYTVMIKGLDNTYRNDIVAVTETSANVLTVDLTEARNIKIAVTKVANI